MIIDSHLHLLPEPDVNKEMALSKEKDIAAVLCGLSSRIKKAGIAKGMAIILDTGFLTNKKVVQTIKELNKTKKISNLMLSAMIDFRSENARSCLETFSSLGFKVLKFHPVHQKILPQDYKKAKELALAAAKQKIIIMIDTNNVGQDSDVYSGLHLAKYLLTDVKTPVILAHSGGLKVLEALVIALDYKNVYLETSFSVPFWQKSSVEKDLAFAFKKLGSNRCIYGSDAPFIDLKDSLKKTNKFFKDNNFSKKDVDNIMYNTANKISTLNI